VPVTFVREWRKLIEVSADINIGTTCRTTDSEVLVKVSLQSVNDQLISQSKNQSNQSVNQIISQNSQTSKPNSNLDDLTVCRQTTV